MISFPDTSVGKESTCNARDPSLIPELGRSTGERIGYPLQYSWASLVAQLAKNPPPMREIWVQSLVGKIPWRRERLPTPGCWPGEFHGLYSPGGCKKSTWLSDLHFPHGIADLKITRLLSGWAWPYQWPQEEQRHFYSWLEKSQRFKAQGFYMPCWYEDEGNVDSFKQVCYTGEQFQLTVCTNIKISVP